MSAVAILATRSLWPLDTPLRAAVFDDDVDVLRDPFVAPHAWPDRRRGMVSLRSDDVRGVGKQRPRRMRRHVDRAIAEGINFLDTADVTDRVRARSSGASKVVGDDLVIATKCFNQMGEGRNRRGLRWWITRASRTASWHDRIDLFRSTARLGHRSRRRRSASLVHQGYSGPRRSWRTGSSRPGRRAQGRERRLRTAAVRCLPVYRESVLPPVSHGMSVIPWSRSVVATGVGWCR
jgi:aryl-alcohol dehydrogenase (NADP+)